VRPLAPPPAWTLVTPYCKRTRPGRGTNTKAAGFPPLSRPSPAAFLPPFALSLAPTHLGWGTRRHFTRRPRDPPVSKRRHLPNQQGRPATSGATTKLDREIARGHNLHAVDICGVVGRLHFRARISTNDSTNVKLNKVFKMCNNVAGQTRQKRINGSEQRLVGLSASNKRISHKVLGETLADHSRLLTRVLKSSLVVRHTEKARECKVNSLSSSSMQQLVSIDERILSISLSRKKKVGCDCALALTCGGDGVPFMDRYDCFLCKAVADQQRNLQVVLYKNPEFLSCFGSEFFLFFFSSRFFFSFFFLCSQGLPRLCNNTCLMQNRKKNVAAQNKALTFV
jgi:hypothetical protein